MGKSKPQSNRPGYVPKKGWFFDLKSTTRKSKVWFNGQVVPNIAKAEITCDAKDGLLRAKLEIVMIDGRISIDEDEVEVLKRHPGNSPWGITTEKQTKKKPKEETPTFQPATYSERLKSLTQKITGKQSWFGPTLDGIRSSIEEAMLGGFRPYFDVTVAEIPTSPGTLQITANIQLDVSATIRNTTGQSPTKHLQELVDEMLPAGVRAEVQLHTVSQV